MLRSLSDLVRCARKHPSLGCLAIEDTAPVSPPVDEASPEIRPDASPQPAGFGRPDLLRSRRSGEDLDIRSRRSGSQSYRSSILSPLEESTEGGKAETKL